MENKSEIEITAEIKEKASKCTTAEELTALAQEYDVELTQEEISGILKINNIKELNDDALDQVSGGESHAERTAKYLPKDHGKFLDKYEAEHYLGQKVYVVEDSDREIFYWGTLVDSCERKSGPWSTRRTHFVLIEGKNDYWRGKECTGETEDFYADDFSIYLMH